MVAVATAAGELGEAGARAAGAGDGGGRGRARAPSYAELADKRDRLLAYA